MRGNNPNQEKGARAIGSSGQRPAKTKVAPIQKEDRPLYTDGDATREITIVTPTDVDPEPYRTPWRRDYARVIHSPAFRRLQGKTQLFPGVESDFFRNRLTHSMEVAQIAKSIAIKINNTVPFFQRDGFSLNYDLIEEAALVHDIGHPPFGHNGEKALDECMKTKGGFEGNAQTLRILAKLEKRQKREHASNVGISNSGTDERVGLNLCHRTLAAALKYDQEIEYDRAPAAKLQKGYYRTESDLVKRIKKSVTGDGNFRGTFKTIECQIMDLADDIAYSTYDLEDAFKGRFITPFSLFGARDNVRDEVVSKVSKGMGKAYTPPQLISCLYKIFADLFVTDTNEFEFTDGEGFALFISYFMSAADRLVTDGYLRSKFTSELVARFISGVQVDPNPHIPALSKVYLREDILEQVEVLKHFTFSSIIMSPRLKVSEYRGIEIVREIFNVLSDKQGEGFLLLPDDVQTVHKEISSDLRGRVISDFIAGMTDRYAIEFYGRLKSENPETIFKPH